jgi:hypothetical protein
MLVRIDGHVHADLREDILDRRVVDTGNAVQTVLLRNRQQLLQHLTDPAAKLSPLAFQIAKVTQETPEHITMMLRAVALQSQTQLRYLLA